MIEIKMRKKKSPLITGAVGVKSVGTFKLNAPTALREQNCRKFRTEDPDKKAVKRILIDSDHF